MEWVGIALLVLAFFLLLKYFYLVFPITVVGVVVYLLCKRSAKQKEEAERAEADRRSRLARTESERQANLQKTANISALERGIMAVSESYRSEAASWSRERLQNEIDDLETEIAKSPGYIQEYERELEDNGWPQRYGPNPGHFVTNLLECIETERKAAATMNAQLAYLKMLLD